MSKWVWIGALGAVIAVVAWRGGTKTDPTPVVQKAAQQQSAAKATAPSAASSRAPSPATVSAGKPPPGEPPEDILLRFQREEYDEINRAGGMPVVVTASGRGAVLKPKLYSGQKDSCRPVPREPEGSYECSLRLMVTLQEGDNKPGQHAERQFVHWDGVAGEWKRGLASDRRRKAAR